MTFRVLPRAAAFAVTVIAGLPATAAAQTTAVDPHHPETAVAQATPPSATMGPGMMGPGAQPGQSGMMGQGMMSHGSGGQSAQSGRMGAMPMMGMHRPMMKIMFAIADVNGDGGLSFDEITTIHKRVFDRVDAHKDSKVTPEEVQLFLRE